MNSLNSVLIEGNVVEIVYADGTCRFTIETERYFKKGKGIEKEVSRFEVEARGRLGESCADTLKKGRGLRVVGRLAEKRFIGCGPGGVAVDVSHVYIVAEHVEFKAY